MANGDSGLPPPVIPHKAVPWIGLFTAIAGALWGFFPAGTVVSTVTGIAAGLGSILLGMGPGARKSQ